ncbi:hypothetical protein Ahy_B02g061311 [Arachis hypogaea]|uniref:CR-type domain-containing protein n=1 Tax=Arachis hypogaea TaxID=3818 RepID=A0A445AKK7_ARAHY|nr:hypothetical protein Ahy_B02g061311 [Arachis hypogaea]
MGGGHDPFDIFQSFFGGSPFGGGFERFVDGFFEQVVVAEGGGRKGEKIKEYKSGNSTKCAGCQGTVMKVSIRHLGPSIIQQMQHPCNECKGTGETISDRDRCPQCKGEKVVQEKKVLEVHVD